MSRLPWRPFAALVAELLLAAAVAGLLLAFAWTRNVVFDLTPTREHTLSDAARRAAARLDRDVRVTVFFNGQDQGKIRTMRELLRRFGEQSSRFRFDMVDLDRSPLLANSMGVVNYDTAVIDGYDRRLRGVRVTEEDLTTELIRLVEGRERVAVFAVGHGERDPGDTDPRAGLSAAAKALAAENFRVERAADLRGGVPADASLLVVAGPTSDFTESEVESVRAFLRAGGGALFLLEAGAPARVAGLLASYGLAGGNDLVVDDRNRLFHADAFAPQVSLFNEQILPYTGAPPAILPLAQSVNVEAPSEPDVRLAPFAFTGNDTWSDAERISADGRPPVFREGIDKRGPVPVAAIARVESAPAPGAPGPARNGSVLLVGDAEFATNLYVGTLGNRDFFVNLAHLAARTEELISTRRSATPGGTFSQLHLTAGQARAIFWSGCVVLPAIVLAIGGALGLRRRRRGGR